MTDRPVPLRGPRTTSPVVVDVVVDGTAFRVTTTSAMLACCAVEVAALDAARPEGDDLWRAADPAHHVLVVAGTVTVANAPGVRRLLDAMPEPRSVLAFGACADSGGPYWDSYAVVPGVDQVLPVDVFVPGCPPRPEALLDGLHVLAGRLADAVTASS